MGWFHVQFVEDSVLYMILINKICFTIAPQVI